MTSCGGWGSAGIAENDVPAQTLLWHANLPHGTPHPFHSLINRTSLNLRRGVTVMFLAAAIMLIGALGAIAITVAGRPSADRFLKW